VTELDSNSIRHGHLTTSATSALSKKFEEGGARGGLSFEKQFTLSVTNTNDAPVLDASKLPTAGSIKANSGPPIGAVGVLVSKFIDFATPSGQVDNVTDQDAGTSLGIAIVGANTANGTWWYSLDSGANWTKLGNVGITGARLLAADAATRVYFQPKAGFVGDLSAALTFRAWDRSTGGNGGFVNTGTNYNGGTTPFSSDTDTISISVTNAAPTLDTTKTPLLPTIVEDSPRPSNGVVAGTPISALIDAVTPAGGLDNYNDADGNTNYGIAITAADTSGGSWSFTIDGGATWHGLGTVSESTPRLLAADGSTYLYFTPKPDYNGTATIKFAAWDRTSGYNGALAASGNTGGSSALSAASDNAVLTITAVNDAPVLNRDKSPTLNPATAGAGVPVGAVGSLLSFLLAIGSGIANVTDADAGTELGIAVTRVETSVGSWFYSTNNGSTWKALSVSTANARLLALDSQTRIYLKVKPGVSGPIDNAVSFRAWDRTSGTVDGLANVTTAGGTTAFSTYGDTASLQIQS
jgi:hypothetical protein